MSQAPRERRIGRSIIALLAGFFLVVILSLATDLAMHAAGIFPVPGQPMSDGHLLLLATAYRTLYGVAGSYLTARLAPYRPMLHAMIGGLVGLALSVIGAIVTWNKGPAFGPHWYPVALIALALPQAWLGGFLHRKTQPII
jgi:hypothetical protein